MGEARYANEIQLHAIGSDLLADVEFQIFGGMKTQLLPMVLPTTVDAPGSRTSQRADWVV